MKNGLGLPCRQLLFSSDPRNLPVYLAHILMVYLAFCPVSDLPVLGSGKRQRPQGLRASGSGRTQNGDKEKEEQANIKPRDPHQTNNMIYCHGGCFGTWLYLFYYTWGMNIHKSKLLCVQSKLPEGILQIFCRVVPHR